MDVWTSDDDLPDSSVTAVAQTPDGYLWVGTLNGLARFDGVRFVHFDPLNTPALKHARVFGLFVDSQGTLWINTYDGSMTAFRNGIFTHVWQGGLVSSVFSGSNQTCFALWYGDLVCATRRDNQYADWRTNKFAGLIAGNSFHQDKDGTLWCLLRSGSPAQIVGTNFIIPGQYSPGIGKANYLTADDGGRIWLGTDRGIFQWNGNRFEDRTPTNGMVPVNVTFLFCTVTNGCWVFANGEVRKSVGRQWVSEVPSWDCLTRVDPGFLGVYQDRSGRIWFCQLGLGLFYATPDGSVERISSTNGLPGDRASCWCQDREGNIWVGIDRGGLVRLRERQFKVIDAAQGLSPPAASTVCEDYRGNIWIGTFGGGLNRWHEGKLERFDLPGGANRASFFSVFPDADGRLWLSAGREDLYLFETNQICPYGESVHGIKVILLDRQGRVWMGRQNGLTCLENGTLKNFGTREGFPRTDVRALAEDARGVIWIGTGEGVLFKFEDGQFTSYTTNDGLEDQAIWSLCPDRDGVLWVGTFRGGLLRFKDGKFTRYTTRDGLPSNVICQILDDLAGHLWIGSHKGIFCISKDTLRNGDASATAPVRCYAYGLADGLPTMECTGNYQPSGWRSRDGRLWFATVKGVVSIDPRKISINLVPPPVAIEEVQVDGKAINDKPGADSPLSPLLPDTTLQIPPGKHQLDINFTALSFAVPQKVSFRYRLHGLDNDWVNSGAKRSAHYGPLPPGDYRFTVIACNNDGLWNEQGATIGIRVLPQFWETWWFNGLAGAAFLGGIAGAASFAVTRRLRLKLERFQQQRAVERERERIARDIHDDLGAGLTQIMLQSALARRGSPAQIQVDLTQITDTARDLVRAMDEIVWAVNPENDTLEGLATYIGKYAQEFVSSAGIHCRLDLPAELPLFALSAEVRHNLFLAIKEVLNNTVKHAQATDISLQLKVQENGFAFVIKDNGRGFNAAAADGHAPDGLRAASGYGLRNISKRLADIGGSCKIVAEPGKGTQVELAFATANKNAITGNQTHVD